MASYYLISLSFISIIVLLLKDSIPKAYKTGLVVLAFSLATVSFCVQIYIETQRVPELISQYHEEIDDFRGWKSDEAKYRILGNIKRLSRLGEVTFDLNRCYLGGGGIDLKGLKMKNSDLNHIDLSNTYISDCLFENVNFVGAKFIRANIVRSSFINCKIDKANFFDATLFTVDFNGSDLSHFGRTNNLDKARVIYDCKNIKKRLLQIIQSQKPTLLEKPTPEKMIRWPSHLRPK